MQFLENDFHLPNNAGLKTLIEHFYNSIINEAPVPLSDKEILLTSKIMDKLFKQINNQQNLREDQ
jgi:hypothetical protein